MNLQQTTLCASLAILLACIVVVHGYWKAAEEGPDCISNTCRESDDKCECSLTIEHRLTMTTKDPLLVVQSGEKLYYCNDTCKRIPLPREDPG
jgi:hypothetical protein